MNAVVCVCVLERAVETKLIKLLRGRERRANERSVRLWRRRAHSSGWSSFAICPDPS